MKQRLKEAFTSFPFCIATYATLALAVAIAVLAIRTYK